MSACERIYTGCDVDVDYWPDTTRPENLNQVRRVLETGGEAAQRQEARRTFDLLVKERDRAERELVQWRESKARDGWAPYTVVGLVVPAGKEPGE